METKCMGKAKTLVRCFVGDDRVKYEARHSVLSAVARQWDFRLYNHNLSWFHDHEFLSIWGGFPGTTREVKDRRFNLFQLAKSIRGLPGDTAECGVFEGAASYLIIRSQEETGKRHHIFDSFEGLSQPTDRDEVEQERTFKWKMNDLAVPEDVVRGNLSGFDNVRYYKGWIPSRFDEVKDVRFSFVHIDVDLYDPTYDSVAFFYDRMVPGGIILCDDFGFESCPGAFRGFLDAMEGKPEGVVHLTSGQGMIVKQ